MNDEQSAVTINNLGKPISSLQKFELAVPWSNKDEFHLFLITFAIICLSDHDYLSLTFKVWLFFVIWFCKLIYHDVRKAFYHFPRIRFRTSPSSESLVLKLNASSDAVHMADCEFSMTTVKILDDEIPAAVKANLQPSELPTRLLFRLTVTTKRRRWNIWKRYEEYYSIYLVLFDRYQNEKIPKLKSYNKLCKTFKKENLPGMSTMTTLSTLDTNEQDRFLCDQTFLQLLQTELLRWMNEMRGSLSLGDDEVFRDFLGLEPVVSTLDFSPLKSRFSQVLRRKLSSIRRNNHSNPCIYPLTMEVIKPHVIAEPVATGNGFSPLNNGVAAYTAPTTAINSDKSPLKSVNSFAQQPSSQPQQQQPSPEKNNIKPQTATATTSNTFYRGHSIETFEFLDKPPELQAFTKDCQFSHGFKVRGRSYMTDKKKIEASPAIGRMLQFDCLEVDTKIFGDRHDHVGRLPFVRKRLQAICSLPERPLVMLINFQLPGDPPYSGLGYFAIPRHFHADVGVSESLQAAKKLFERFVDIPYSDEDDGDVQEEEEEDQEEDDGKWRDIEAVTVNDIPDTPQQHSHQQQAPFFSDPSSSTTTEDIAPLVKTDSRTVQVEEGDVIGEAKIVRHLTAMDLRSVMAKQQSSQPQQSAQASHDSSQGQLTPPRPHPTSRTTTAENENDNNSNSSPPKRGLQRVNSMPLKAVNPTKQWASDIAWAKVSEPGVLERKAFQNMRFKLIPQMLEAPWVLQMAVASTPCLLGTKIVQRYFKGRFPLQGDPTDPLTAKQKKNAEEYGEYFEIDMHVGSSSIANNIVGLCRTYAKNFSVNLGVVIQGEKEDELPEQVLFCMTLIKMDMVKMAAHTAEALKELPKEFQEKN